jgi:hypothetical protein
LTEQLADYDRLIASFESDAEFMALTRGKLTRAERRWLWFCAACTAVWIVSATAAAMSSADLSPPACRLFAGAAIAATGMWPLFIAASSVRGRAKDRVAKRLGFDNFADTANAYRWLRIDRVKTISRSARGCQAPTESAKALMGDRFKWQQLAPANGRVVDLGRPLVFLIPAEKLGWTEQAGATVRDRLHEWLVLEFGAFTATQLPHFGYWHSVKQQCVIHDQCIQYEVAFGDEPKVTVALAYLADLARKIDEECIYVKVGEHAAVLSPTA